MPEWSRLIRLIRPFGSFRGTIGKALLRFQRDFEVPVEGIDAGSRQDAKAQLLQLQSPRGLDV